MMLFQSPFFVFQAENLRKIMVYFLYVLASQRLISYEEVSGFEPQICDKINL